MRSWSLLLTTWMTTGCSNALDKVSSDTAPEASSPFSVRWGTSTVELIITGDDDPNHIFFFGMAETIDSCGGLCWTGEDCLYGTEDYLYCHQMSNTGGALVYGGNPENLAEGFETVFGNDTSADRVTYYISLGDRCWVGGEDPSYYEDLSCFEIDL